jgi:Fe-S-cluster containining protein
MTPTADKVLLQIVDAALADTARRSGEWLACKPGCSQCCVGVFAIHQLDAVRLRQGLQNLDKNNPQRAAAVLTRARESAARLVHGFPGNATTGLLDTSEEAEARFEEFANDEPCPALDPATGTCDLYEARPMTCRMFGPPVRSEDGLGVCELCYHGATEEQIVACEMFADVEDLETALVQECEQSHGKQGRTVVAFALILP